MILDEAKNLMLGNKKIERVYCGANIVWGLLPGWGRYVFTGSEKIDIPSSVINGFSAFRYLGLNGAALPPYKSNEFTYFNGPYSAARDRCIAMYVKEQGQMFFIIPDTEIPHNDTVAFRAWLKDRYDSGNPVIVDYVLA